MPVAFWASATLKDPTAVFCAPAPSLMSSVAVEPLVLSAPLVPLLGVLVSVHGPLSRGHKRLVEGRDHPVDPAVAVVVEHLERLELRCGLVDLVFGVVVAGEAAAVCGPHR